MAMDEMLWYYTFATDIERIKNIYEPKCAQDVLDRERADYILDHSRIARLFVHKHRMFELQNRKWDFRDTFSTAHYERFIDNLGSHRQKLCKRITYGDMYCSKVNAYAYPDPKWGDFVCINVSISFFAYFMLLALIEPLKFEIPENISKNALRIGLRTWLGCETLDFEMDPRGILPDNVEADIKMIIPHILTFIAGHEFSHHLLGHCNKGNLKNLVLWGKDETHSQRVYNNSQKDEFAADLGSLSIPLYAEDMYERIFQGSLLWFCILDLVEYAISVMNPASLDGYQTHPSAEDRFNYIIRNAKHTKHFSDEPYKLIIARVQELKKFIDKDIAENYGELYDDELYGSLYLDEPNTKWRGKELIDRVDY